MSIRPSAPPSEIFASNALAGQVALVTGGGTGLGRAAAVELARCGATVMIAGRREEVLEQATIEIDAARSRDAERPSSVAGDIRDPGAAQRIIATVLERHGRLDTLVNNAGGQYFAPAEGVLAKGWQAVWRLNVNGTMHMIEEAVQQAMHPARHGMIINVTLSPHHGMPGMVHSGAARAAVEAMTSELATQWREIGIAVTAVAAGHYATEATEKYPEEVRALTARSVPLGRMGEVEEHAWLIALLASPVGRALSGSVLTLDGGRDNWLGPWPPASLLDTSGEVPTERRPS